MTEALLILAGYLCGSLPTGVWVARHAGVDVWRSGSGNIGATNVARTAGAQAAALTLAGDLAKGSIAVWLARRLGSASWVGPAAGLAAIVGHVHSIFLGFAGGKGVATTCGVFLVLNPTATLVAAAVFGVAAATTGYVSVGSLSAAVALGLACWLMGSEPAVRLTAWIAAGLVIAHHCGNVQRLLQGKELKFRVKR